MGEAHFFGTSVNTHKPVPREPQIFTCLKGYKFSVCGTFVLDKTARSSTNFWAVFSLVCTLARVFRFLKFLYGIFLPFPPPEIFSLFVRKCSSPSFLFIGKCKRGVCLWLRLVCSDVQSVNLLFAPSLVLQRVECISNTKVCLPDAHLFLS
jgi:hypothetical protein